MALTKVTGDFIKAGSITQGHLHSSHGITTSHITEGDKLFFTNARVDSRVGSLSTSNLSEGTNLYYTNARARAAISGTGSLSYNSTTGVMSFTMPAQNTSNITEGTNLYYTDARADARIAAADTGDLSEGTNLYYTQARFNTAFTAKSTSDLSEGTNLYYTDARADARITAADTDSLSEGSTNLYYTDARADARVALIVDSSPAALNTLNELAAALGDDANFSTTVTNSIATKMPLAGGTFSGQVIFPSAATTKPVLPNGFISRNDETDTSGRHDIWGISEKYYPSNSTAGDAWGIQWAGTPNDVVFVGGGTDRFSISLDEGNISAAGTVTASGGNSGQWNTAYGWGDHAGGGYAADSAVMKLTGNQTISGTKTFDNGSIVISGTHGTISFMDTTSGEDNFYLHTNSNNFYVLADRDATDAIDSGYDSPHPLQLEGDTNTAYVFGSALNIGNWNTAYGWGDHGAAGYLTSSSTQGKYIRSDADDAASGIITLTKNTATGLANSTFSHAKTIIGGIHFANGNGPGANNGNQAAITFQGSSASEAQAGIYVHNNNSQGTHMLFATTDSYATGPQAGITLLNNGNVTIRGTVGASNFSGSSSGTNTGDQDLSSYLTSFDITTQTDGKYLRSNTADEATQRIVFSGCATNNHDTIATSTGSQGSIEIFNTASGNDAFMSFHTGGDFALYFGLDGGTNKLSVGGWSMGAASYEIYHAGNKPSLATLGYSGAANANYITNNNQLTNGAGYTTNTGTLTSSIGGTKLGFGSGATGATFGNNHYSMGVDIANGAWSNPHYSDLIIGYHTGIRIGAAYSGTRFYSNSPTTDTNNTGNGNGNEVLIFTCGGAAGANDTKVEGIGYAGESFRAPIFYDSGSTGYYVDPASTSRLLNLDFGVAGYYIKAGDWGPRIQSPHGWIQFGPANTSHAHIYTDLSNFYFNKQIILNGGSVINQNDIRAKIFYDIDNTNYYIDPNSTSYVKYLGRREHQSGHFVGSYNNIGGNAAKSNPIYTIGSSYNPNETTLADMYGVGYAHPNLWGSGKTSDWGLYIANNGSVDATIGDGSVTAWFASQVHAAGDFRAPVFYDLNNTGYYVNPDSTSNVNAMNFAGVADFNGGHGGVNITNTSILSSASSSWTGDPGGAGKIQYHSNRWYIVSDSSSNMIVQFRRNGSDVSYIDNAGRLMGAPDLRVPIYYDTDTNYYGDFASTSSLKLLKTGQNHQVNTPRWDTAFYVAQSQHYYAHSSTQAMYIGESNTINIRSVGIASGSLRAPLFYDSGNTGYYLDAGSTSNLNAATFVGTVSGQNAYFAQSVGIGFTSGNIGGRFNVKNSAAGQIAAKLQLGASVNSASTGVFINTTASYASSGMFLHFQSNHISGDDNVLIAYLDGDIVNKNNSYTQYSDQRLKENIVDATSKLDEIKQIRVRNFNFIGEDLKQIGVVAQELEPIFPGLVKEREVPGHDDPIKTVKYSVMVPILIKAMQEQQTIIDDLKSRLETLENQ